MSASALLAPLPSRSERTGETLRHDRELSIWIGLSGPDRDLLTARTSDAIARLGLRARPAAEPSTADLALHPASDLAPQAYRLEATDSGWRVEAGDAAGAFYGLCTLAQWLELHRSPDGHSIEAPRVRVEDAPAFPTRGAMLDVSRNRVPTMETLFGLVDRLAALKVNHLQLYVEHTFAYEGHETVWQGWSPLTAEEIRALDAYCRERFVELAPNQNSFGHLHRWLVHDGYRELAECPEGIEHPFGDEREPFSLCPTDPRSLELLADLYRQLLPNFTSSHFNVGLDETFDLGRGRSAAEVESRGKGRVYLDFLKRVHGLVEEHGRRMLFWGDIVLEHPELIPELPEDVVALEWGYEADHPFAEHAGRFADSGREFWVCPGTSSWLSFAGRATNALGNLENAAVNGLANGATGYLVTDWGDQGHLQPLCASYLGWVAGAWWGWSAGRDHAVPDLAVWGEQIDHWLLSGDAEKGDGGEETAAPARGLGRAIGELAEVYRLPGPLPMNRSVLFSIVHRVGGPLCGGAFDGLAVEGLERAAQAVRATRGGVLSGNTSSDEVRWTADALLLACELGLRRIELGRERPASELPLEISRRLRDRARALGEALRRVWLARHRPGGLDASLHWWSRIERSLFPAEDPSS